MGCICPLGMDLHRPNHAFQLRNASTSSGSTFHCPKPWALRFRNSDRAPHPDNIVGDDSTLRSRHGRPLTAYKSCGDGCQAVGRIFRQIDTTTRALPQHTFQAWKDSVKILTKSMLGLFCIRLQSSNAILLWQIWDATPRRD